MTRVGEFTHQSGFQWAMELLTSDEPPTAIFCANDVIAFGALDATRRLQIKVPEQVSIVGFDDIPMAGWDTFSLTTVRQQLTEMARDAAQDADRADRGRRRRRTAADRLPDAPGAAVDDRPRPRLVGLEEPLPGPDRSFWGQTARSGGPCRSFWGQTVRSGQTARSVRPDPDPTRSVPAQPDPLPPKPPENHSRPAAVWALWGFFPEYAGQTFTRHRVDRGESTFPPGVARPTLTGSWARPVSDTPDCGRKAQGPRRREAS